MSDTEDIFQVRKLTDYSKCCCCQDKSKTNIRYPYKREQDHAGYESLETDLTELVDSGIVLPWGLNLACIDDGSGIVKTLLKSKAIYHAKCRTTIRKLIQPIREAKENKAKNNDDAEADQCSPAKTRKTCDLSYDRNSPVCFKCGPNSPPEKKMRYYTQHHRRM